MKVVKIKGLGNKRLFLYVRNENGRQIILTPRGRSFSTSREIEETNWNPASIPPKDEADCELYFDTGVRGYGFYTGNDPNALDGWMCAVNIHDIDGKRGSCSGQVVAWRKLNNNKK